ncbi:PilZ domain-containing protein [Pseudomonas sp. ZM23]|uniref:PilZ domain-containing protein n=1 Tax=Pseudomonas triclosanedens TaxID=2961893 RepID=A0ABY6ZV89_9PSED|nr:PilZ domain-containing protein [Pseudomonas triclosanedens]MCP8466707.1 PilZ domain-containing protein [Pseudomonas triclosanedens]MCP8471938.1 PilZ domain-containing protein [Pseudomonas triclosanedens]MCP8474678.1 PilZ domain-containing protein [Pseudomonas triclosanedens]WAI47950.1 PilZ domain-containing protein [Pseudomonas triclosanedens]
MSSPDADDRREYYRIEDTLALEFRPLRGDEIRSEEVLQDDSALFNLLSDLHLADFESQHLLRHINERDRPLASYLKVINKRIDLIAQALTQSVLREIGPSRKVTLSEGGIDFCDPQPMPVGQGLALKIVLLPQGLGLLLRARVTHCRQQDGGDYAIGTEFETLSDTQRQLLARHILQRQALERRLAKARSE